MTDEEWASSNSAQNMLSKLHRERPRFLRTQIYQLHKFLVACSWKHQHLIPQDGLRNGLRGAEKYIAGEIGNAELDRLNYYAEADAFAIDYAKSPEEISELKSLINGIEEVRELPFDQARTLLLRAAYFAEGPDLNLCLGLTVCLNLSFFARTYLESFCRRANDASWASKSVGSWRSYCPFLRSKRS